MLVSVGRWTFAICGGTKIKFLGGFPRLGKMQSAEWLGRNEKQVFGRLPTVGKTAIRRSGLVDARLSTKYVIFMSDGFVGHGLGRAVEDATQDMDRAVVKKRVSHQGTLADASQRLQEAAVRCLSASAPGH